MEPQKFDRALKSTEVQKKNTNNGKDLTWRHCYNVKHRHKRNVTRYRYSSIFIHVQCSSIFIQFIQFIQFCPFSFIFNGRPTLEPAVQCNNYFIPFHSFEWVAKGRAKIRCVWALCTFRSYWNWKGCGWEGVFHSSENEWAGGLLRGNSSVSPAALPDSQKSVFPRL